MHVLESYALQNDLKIDKPYIYEKFFPMVVDKFITIDTSNLGTEALSYDHWQHVVNLIYPYLKEKKIAIVNLGDKNSIPLSKPYPPFNFFISRNKFNPVMKEFFLF